MVTFSQLQLSLQTQNVCMSVSTFFETLGHAPDLTLDKKICLNLGAPGFDIEQQSYAIYFNG